MRYEARSRSRPYQSMGRSAQIRVHFDPSIFRPCLRVHVDPRGFGRRMTEHEAHVFKRLAALHEVRRARVTKAMRCELRADRTRSTVHDALESLAREAEEPLAGGRQARCDERAHGGDGRRADRHDARVATFAAANVDERSIEI